MTKQQLKSLIKECVCEIQQSLAEKKHKKSEAPKAEKKNKKSEDSKAKKAVAKPAPVKNQTKKDLAKVAPPKNRLTTYDAVQLAGRQAAAEKMGNKQAARDLNLAKQAANLMLKTGKSKID